MDQAQLDRCLTDAEFEKLHSGDLSAADESTFQEHLETCSKCWSRYEEILGDDPIFQDLKSAWHERASVVGFRSSVRTEAFADVRAPGAGLRIEGYQIISELGRGGMGVVYEAIQTKLNRRVALKVLPAGQGHVTRDAVTRFRREATAAAKLHHTNIVPVYDFGESGNTYYYAMELIDGQPLTRVIRRLAAGDDPTIMQAHSSAGPAHSQVSQANMMGAGSARGHYRQIARWMADAADALHYAHSQGIIHRDIKPGNLVMSNDGRVMILDFGLAKSVDDISMTRTGTMIGTLRYMSPEQVMAKEKKLDHRTDVYSLGATLYELLTFQAAFKGRDQKELLGQIVNREPMSPRKIVPEIPREMETICLKTLEKDPGDRYATSKALAEDLRRFYQDLPIVARPVGPVGRATKFVRRRPWLSLASAVSFLLIVSVVFAVTFGRRAREKNIEALMQAGVRLLQIENADPLGASDLFNQILGIDPDNTRAMINLAIVKKDLFNQTEEMDLLQQSIEHSRHAISLLEAKVSLDSERVGESSETNEARIVRLIGALNILGIVQKKLNNFDQAAAAYERAIEVQPDYAPAWENLAVVFALQGNLEQANEKLLEAAELARDRPSLVGAWRNLGAVQLELKDPECEQTLLRAIEINNEDAGTWLLLTRAYLHFAPVRNLKQAYLKADNAQSRAKEDPRAKRLYAIAEMRQKEPDLDNAIRLATEAIKLGGNKAFNHLILAIAYARLGEPGSARQSYQAALANWPNDLQADRVQASHDGALLWFEHYADLEALRREAESLLLPE